MFLLGCIFNGCFASCTWRCISIHCLNLSDEKDPCPRRIGSIGKTCCERTLQDAGFDVTVAGRSAREAQAHISGSQRSLPLMYSIKVTLLNAMKGQEIVYINFSVEQNSKKSDPQPEREGMTNVV